MPERQELPGVRRGMMDLSGRNPKTGKIGLHSLARAAAQIFGIRVKIIQAMKQIPLQLI